MLAFRASFPILLLASCSLMGGTQAYVGLCCSQPSQISVLSAAKGTNRSLIGPPNAFGMALSPDGSIAYVASTSGISALNTTSGALVGSVTVLRYEDQGLVVNKDGKTLYVQVVSGVDFIDTSSFQITRTVALNLQYSGLGMVVSPDGTELYVPGVGQPPYGLTAIDTATGQISLIALPSSDYSWAAAVTPDGSELVVAAASTGIYVLDRATGQVLNQISLTAYCGSGVYSMALSADGTLVYLTVISNCATETYALVAFQLSSGNLLFQTAMPGRGGLLGMSADGTTLFTAGSSFVYELSTANGSLTKAIRQLGAVLSVAASPDDTLYVLNATNSAVATVDVGTGQMLTATPVGSHVQGLGFDPGGTGTWALTGPGGSNTLLVLNANDQIQGFTPHFGGYAVAFSNGMAYITAGPLPSVGGSVSGLINVVDVAARTLSTQIDLPIPSACSGISPPQFVMSPDGSRLYVGILACPTGDPPLPGHIFEIDTATNTVLNHQITGPILGALALTPDGSTLFAGEDLGRIARIDTATFTVQKTLQFTPGHVTWYGVAVSPDGTKAYAVNPKTATVIVFDPKTGSQTGSLHVGTEPHLVAFTPDGTEAYVLDHVADSISVIDTATDTVAGTISMGSPTTEIVFGGN
jgi:YVTN family beta-propeller protein